MAASQRLRFVLSSSSSSRRINGPLVAEQSCAELSHCDRRKVIFVAQFLRKKELGYDFPNSARQRKVAKSQEAHRPEQRNLR